MNRKLNLHPGGSEVFSGAEPSMGRPAMFHFSSLCLTLICSLLLGSCSGTDSYRITLRDGREFVTASRPQMQTKTGYYRYKNFQGRDALIRADEVLLIEHGS
jgi:hypothetical protein